MFFVNDAVIIGNDFNKVGRVIGIFGREILVRFESRISAAGELVTINESKLNLIYV